MSDVLEKLSKQELIDRMNVLQEVAVSLISGKSKKQAMTFLMEKAMELCPCDGGTLYLLDKDKKKINSEVMINMTFAEKPLGTFSIPLRAKSIATYSFTENTPLLIEDVYILDPVMGITFNVAMDKNLNYRTKSMMALPLVKTDGTAIGLIQLINRKNFLHEKWPKEGETLNQMRGFTTADRAMLERLIELAVASLENWYAPSEDLPEFKENEDFIV